MTNRLPVEVKYLSVVILAAAAYFALTYYTNGFVWGKIPGLPWMQESFGRLAGTRIWMHSVHALALLVAAIPSAILVSITCRPRSMVVAAIAGALTFGAGFAPTILNDTVRALLDNSTLVHMTIDGIKFVLILMALTWLADKLLRRRMNAIPGR